VTLILRKNSWTFVCKYCTNFVAIERGRLIRFFRTVIINLVFFLYILTLYYITVGCEAPDVRIAHRRGVPGTFVLIVLHCVACIRIRIGIWSVSK